jgi:hypothetical protein
MATTTKTVKGKVYLYYAYYDSVTKRKKEIYCGRVESPEAQLKAKELERSHLEMRLARVEDRLARFGGGVESVRKWHTASISETAGRAEVYPRAGTVSEPATNHPGVSRDSGIAFRDDPLKRVAYQIGASQEQLELQKRFEGQPDLQGAISRVKDGYQTATDWYEGLEEGQTKNFVRLVALFPSQLWKTYSDLYRFLPLAETAALDSEKIRRETGVYIRFAIAGPSAVVDDVTNRLSWISEKSLEAVSDMVLGESRFLNLPTLLLDVISIPEVTLQATARLRELVRRSAPDVLKVVRERFDSVLKSGSPYVQHMIAYLFVDEVETNGYSRKISEYFHRFLMSDEAYPEAVFIIKTLARDKTRVDQFVQELVNQEDAAGLRKLIDGLRRPIGDIENSMTVLKAIQASLVGSSLKEREVLLAHDEEISSDIARRIPIINEAPPSPNENLVKNGNFELGLKYWFPTGNDDEASYEAVQRSSVSRDEPYPTTCRVTEKNPNNLGRLFQDLTPLLNNKMLIPGRRYRLRARIKTAKVDTRKRDSTGGATIGVSYVDESGWTPLILGYQCEVYHVDKPTQWDVYIKTFTLDGTPPDGVRLYVYFDFNSASGKAEFTDVSLTEVDMNATNVR